MSFSKAELLLDLRAELAEGAIWNPLTGRLNFVDILGKKVYEYDPETGRQRSWSTPTPVGTVVPRTSGGLAVALWDGISHLDTQTGAVRHLARPAEHDPEKARFNDGKCDPQGRLWAGTLGKPYSPGKGALYRFAAGAAPRQMLAGISISNGLAWSLDSRTLYYIDSATRKVDAFDFDPGSGDISRRRTVIAAGPDQGLPDGCTLDAEGKLWVAHWDGYAVNRWDPETGRHLGKIEVPVPQVSSCAFGGKNLDTLYITTAREDMSAADVAKVPTSGSIYACRPGVRGIPANCYLG